MQHGVDKMQAKVLSTNAHCMHAPGGQFIFNKAPDYASYPAAAQIWLDDVVCNGTETTLAACTASEWGVNNCLHSEDVSIR
jgi:hypothetical protein